MEEKIFPRPAVAEELAKYIEARLHTDGGPRQDENQKLQREMTGSIANPIYVIVDPQTGERVRVHAGFTPAERFIDFLRG